MGIVYLADTNIVSELMHPYPNKAVETSWKKHKHEVALSSITWHELLIGIYLLPRSKRRTALEKFLIEDLEDLLSILPYDQKAAHWHASERARLIQLGQTPAYVDGQIAAVAATNDLVVVTRNVKDFLDFNLLGIENWFENA